MLYSRRQLAVILLLLGAAAAGIGVGHWRRGHPLLVDSLEALDRATPEIDDAAVAPPPRRAPPAAKPPPPSSTVDVNRATAEQLTTLPRVGAALARRIVESRERAGRFDSVEDLRRVRGVGRATVERLRPLLTAAP